MTRNATLRRVMLLSIPLSMILMGCSSTQQTGSIKADRMGVPYVCFEQWMKDQGYSSDGRAGQVIGEDTEQTVSEIRHRNASLRKFCKRG